MINLFGVTVFVAIGLGFIFPYAALAMSEYGFVFLFLLMFFSGFSVDWRRLRSSMSRPGPVLAGLGLVFVVLPLLQWGLTELLIANRRMSAGMLFASLMPVAMVAPYFCRRLDADSELSYAVMLLSTLLTPLISPVLFYYLGGSELPIKTVPLILSIGLFSLVPFLISAAAAAWLPAVRNIFLPRLGVLNAVTLGVLIFILFGAVVMKLNVAYISQSDVARIFLLALIQDFGVYLLVRQVGRFFTDDRTAKTLAISLAMKNVAISAGILLFYDPQAALPSALVFLAHGFLFTWLGRRPRPA